MIFVVLVLERSRKTLPEYIDKKEIIEFLKQTRQRLPQDSKDFFTRDNMLLNFEQIVSQMNTIDTAKSKYAYWVLTAEQGSCYDYHVKAHCSNCGWEWVGKDDECVGNNRYVFSAFVKGEKELAKQFVIDNAKQRSLYNFCPNCGSKMGDDEA